MDIEDVLRWAYRDELPKQSRDRERLRSPDYPSTSPMFRGAALGTRVDMSAREPGFPLALGECHPDALIVAEAVQALARFEAHTFDGPLGLSDGLGPDLEEAERRAMARAMAQIVATTVSCAVRGARPVLVEDTVEVIPVRHATGGHPVVWVEQVLSEPKFGGGTVERTVLAPAPVTRAHRHFPDGAHSRIEYDPPAESRLDDRAAYAAFWAALDVLAVDLAGKLQTIAVLPPAAAQQPWAGDVDAGKPREVFADAVAAAKLKDQRETEIARRLLAQRRRYDTARRGRQPLQDETSARARA